ncbi:MAG TPA: PilZ domain-containing protein [Candidatus Dormibacteraeota bacterium]|nr:PilZ domain-containing protein [Candidatus Dormibacteraeota bacterium]
MMQRNGTLQPAKERAVRRCPFVASVEVTDVNSGARLSARISELAMGGCYVDALNPFPTGTLITLRILRDQGAFEAKAKVVYCDPKFGMGVAFTEMARDQRAILEGWLAEIICLLRPIS